MKNMERSLLGAILADPEQLYLVGNIITPSMFYTTKHQNLFRAICILHKENVPIDPLTLNYELKKMKTEMLPSEITMIAQEMPTGGAAEYYADMVKDEYTRRSIETILKTNLGAAQDINQNIKDIIGSIQKQLTDAVPANKKGMASVYPDIVDVWEQYLDYEESNTEAWVTTGYKSLDDKMFLVKGSHTIIGASPAEGKTSLGVCILRHVAKSGKRVLLFTLEQTRRRMLQKIISQEAGVSHSNMVKGRLSDDEKRRVQESIEMWTNPNMCVLDSRTGKWGAQEMRLRAIAEHSEFGLDLIIVDLLGLMKKPPDMARDAKEHLIFNKNSEMLQDLAGELEVPIITMAHLNRERFKRPGGRPILSDLREAGEQFADNVAFIFREFMLTQDPTKEHLAEIIIAKNRDGMTGSVELGWRGSSTVFYDMPKVDRPRVLAGGIQ